jgi:hypothetical protein
MRSLHPKVHPWPGHFSRTWWHPCDLCCFTGSGINGRCGSMPKAPCYSFCSAGPPSRPCSRKSSGKGLTRLIESRVKTLTRSRSRLPYGRSRRARVWRFWAPLWILGIMPTSLPIAPTWFTNSMSVPASLMGTRVLRTCTLGSKNFGAWPGRNLATWPSGADMLAL